MTGEVVRCTLTEMIDKNLLQGGIGQIKLYKGFTIGTRGKQLFWYITPTRNGYYAIYPQYDNGEIGRPRYVDACRTIVELQPIK